MKQKANQELPYFTALTNPEIKASRFTFIIIFLALIRCIAEPFRLQYYNNSEESFSDIKLYLVGALTAAIALLIMTVLSFYGKHRWIIGVAVLTIVLLFVEKFMVGS